MYQQKRSRTERDMIVLGGWLFADLLLGLAMLFFTANTVGQPKPVPTPTPGADFLATSEARNIDLATAAADSAMSAAAAATVQANALSTVSAQQSALESADQTATAVAMANNQLTATAVAQATLDAMSGSERATAEAQATAEALAIEATISAFATAQAGAAQGIDSVTRQLATAYALSTAAAATAQANATIESDKSFAAQQTARANATADAEVAAANGTAAAQTARAGRQEARDAEATSETIATEFAILNLTATVLTDIAENSAIEPQSVEIIVNVSPSNFMAGNPEEQDSFITQVDQQLEQYDGCRAGVALIYGTGATEAAAGGIAAGQNLALEAQYLLQAAFPIAFEQTAFIPLADLTAPAGTISMELFLYAGCVAT